MSYQKFTKDVALIALTNLVTAVKGLFILSIITKRLGAESYGVWSQLIITISLLSLAATIGLPYTLVRFLAAEKNKKQIQDGVYSVISVILITASLFALFLIFFSEPIANFFSGEKSFVKILSLIIILECINLVFLNVFRAFQEIKKYSFFIIFQGIGEAGLVAAAVSFGYGLLGALLALLVIRLINFLIISYFIIKKIGFNFPQFARIKEYLSFGLPIIPGNIAAWIIQSGDKYLVNYFLGALFVGYYMPAYTIGSIIMFFIAPLSYVLPAVLSKLFDENNITEVKTYLKYSLKYFLIIAIPSFFGISVLSKQLLLAFSTTEIAQQGYLTVPLVALGALMFGMYSVIGEIISLQKKTQITACIWVVSALLNLGLNFILIPHFGIFGAAITTLISYVLIFLLGWRYSFRYVRFEIDWKFILKSIFASILMSIFVVWLEPTSLWSTIVAILTSMLIYGISMLLLGAFKTKELEQIKRFLNS